MQNTIRDNYDIVHIIKASSNAAGTLTTASIDMSKYESAHFEISVGAVGTGGTVDAKLQDSTDDSTYVDITGKSITQIDEAGTASLYLDSPTKRHLNIVVVVGTDACVLGVTAILKKKYNRVS